MPAGLLITAPEPNLVTDSSYLGMAVNIARTVLAPVKGKNWIVRCCFSDGD